MTQCGHAICENCTQKLNKVECPLCRAPLAGGYLSSETQELIKQREQINNNISKLKTLANVYYVATHTNLSRKERYDNAKSYSDAYELFIIENPSMDFNTSNFIFSEFINFVESEQTKDPTKTPYNLINDFIPTGQYLLQTIS